tara:strand:+ start:113 stop:595 length:483 start_codon:yes stop_codon:yes gene_type:complete
MPYNLRYQRKTVNYAVQEKIVHETVKHVMHEDRKRYYREKEKLYKKTLRELKERQQREKKQRIEVLKYRREVERQIQAEMKAEEKKRKQIEKELEEIRKEKPHILSCHDSEESFRALFRQYALQHMEEVEKIVDLHPLIHRGRFIAFSLQLVVWGMKNKN